MSGKLKRLVAAGAALLAVCTTPVAAQQQAIVAGDIIVDAERGSIGPGVIVVENGRILSVTAGAAAPAGAEVIDLSEKTVLPGLIDLHVHLTINPGGDFWRRAVEPEEWSTIIGVQNAERTVRAGFTTVRDAGSPGEAAFALRRGTAEGLITGPRIIAAGPPLAIIGGHGDVSGFRPEVNEVLTSGFSCTGPVDCAAKVRRAAQNGSDVIKITATGGVLSQQGRGLEAHFSDAEMKSIAETADSLGLKVMAHAHGARGVEAAARAGIDTIEHGTYLDEEAAEAMRANGTVLVPTLMAFQGVTSRLGQGIYTPVVEAKIREVAEAANVFVSRAQELNVPIAFGTDAGVFEHGLNAGEFRLMMAQGMSSRDAVASATTGAARVLGMENELGRLAAGFSADIIAVDGNPLEDATVLEEVDWVMARGVAHKEGS